MPRQLGLHFPTQSAFARTDFIVSPANAVALAMLDRWPDWPQHKLALTGPEGAGKTHLTHIWASRAQAGLIQATDLPGADLEALARTPLAVEDVPLIAKDQQAQTALFHLHNMALANGQTLLMTGRISPNLWGMSLPDLQSRIDAAGHAELAAPDDDLLRAVLEKLFTDRQLQPHPDVIPYLITHIERSFAAAVDIVARLDALSLAEGSAITRPLARRLLDAAAKGEADL